MIWYSLKINDRKNVISKKENPQMKKKQTVATDTDELFKSSKLYGFTKWSPFFVYGFKNWMSATSLAI